MFETEYKIPETPEAPKVELNTEYWHEILDRLHCLQLIVDSTIMNHPTTAQDVELMARVELAMGHISDAYQYAGRKIDFEENGGEG